MTTRTRPLRVGTMRGFTAALLVLAALVALALAMAGLGAGSRQPQLPAVIPSGEAASPPASVATSPAVASASPRTVSFVTDAWTLTYLDGPDWIVETSDTGIGFSNLLAPVGVGVGTLEAAVKPSSIYVTEPDLDRSVETTVAGYLAWLATHPKLDVTDPIDVTVGGLPAKQVDVTLKPGENYAQGSIPSRLGIAVFAGNTVALGPTNGETFRLNLLDIGGATVVVHMSTMEPDTGGFVTAQELVRTFRFGEGS